ncbi:MAG TPA: hypothetical protein VLJ41_07425, partial [Segetibacter sp.]|nr:hypothetical protein [Segetibacter sp.]
MKKIRLVCWLLIIALLSVNVFILLQRNEGYKYFPFKTYSELYVTDSSLYIKDLHFNKDTLDIFFSLKLPR